MTQEKNYLLIDMEIASIDDDGDPPILTDSGTESFNESPIAEGEISEESTTSHQACHIETIIWDIGNQIESNQSEINSTTYLDKTPRIIKNILDKSISVDEDSLIKPLQPIICNVIHSNHLTNNNNMNSLDAERPLMSILRRASNYEFREEQNLFTCRRVSFPTDLDILASYKEPDFRLPFSLNEFIPFDEILLQYQNSCKKHNTIELDVIKNQILEIKNNANHSSTLNLSTVTITMEVCETLEDLFKLVNFRTIIIKDCKFTAETIREFINILEYYNSATEIVTSNVYYEFDAWNFFTLMLARSSIESITFEGFNFAETSMKQLLQIRSNDYLKTLKFSNCKLGNSPIGLLVGMLNTNKTICELYLPQTGLYKKEADCLGKLLSTNHYLKVLDISNNLIGDRGLEVLAKGLCSQTLEGHGLSVLVIFNNQITEKSGQIISNILEACKNLHTLNIGYNNLTDEFVSKIENSLSKTNSLEGLGLQSTLLTDIGIMKIADAIQKNNSLQKINLKGNKAIQKEGLEKLSQALTNTKIIKIELDETNRNCDDPQSFIEIVKQIDAICKVNKSKDQSTDEEVLNWSMQISRKVSLNCEPIYYPSSILTEPVNHSRKKSPSASPIPSPGCSPIPRSRFSVSRVPEVSKTSRFKVVPVITHGGGDYTGNSPPPFEEDEVKQFINVRSSVSSIDSVDSNRDSVYDSATPSGESD